MNAPGIADRFCVSENKKRKRKIVLFSVDSELKIHSWRNGWYSVTVTKPAGRSYNDVIMNNETLSQSIFRLNIFPSFVLYFLEFLIFNLQLIPTPSIRFRW